MKLSRSKVIMLGLVVETMLAVIFFVWAAFRGFAFRVLPDLTDVVFGLLGVLPLCLFSWEFFGPPAERRSFLESFVVFRKEVVMPLAAVLDLKGTLLLSLAAGIGEELFFRGIVQSEFGLVTASLIFSLLHFGPAVRAFPWVSVAYFAIGVYLGVLCQLTQTLWTPIVTHCVYDFIAFVYLNRIFEKSKAALRLGT